MSIEQIAREIGHDVVGWNKGKYDFSDVKQAARLGIIEGLEMAVAVVQTARFTNPESLRDSITDAIRALIEEQK